MTRAERAAPWLAGALLALPTLLSAYPPMADLPGHEALVGMLRHFDDASMFPPGLYARNFGHPNQLLYAVGWALSYLVSTRVAMKLVVAASVVGLPVAASRLAGHLGASRWAAVIVAPVALGLFFHLGLVANIMGLDLLLALLPALDQFVTGPSTRRAARVAGAMVLLYFAHEATMLLYAATLLFFTALARPSPKATALRLAPFALGVAVAVAQLKWQTAIPGAAPDSSPPVFAPIAQKLASIPNAVCGPSTPLFLAPFAMVVLGIVVLAALRLRSAERDGGTEPAAGAFGWAREHRFELVAAGCAIAYLALPYSLHGASYIHQRFLPPAIVLAAVALSPRRAGVSPEVPRLFPLLAWASPVSLALVVWPVFVESNANYADLASLTSLIQKGSATVLLAEAHDDPAHGFARVTLADRIPAERGGRMASSLTESPIAPVRTTPAFEWRDLGVRVSQSEGNFCPHWDLTRFRYVIFHTHDAGLGAVVERAFAPEARVAGRAGDWILLESTLPTVPLTTPDAPAPLPCPGLALAPRLVRAGDEIRAEVRARRAQESSGRRL